ncbi:NADP-dependent oxidoreductase [Salegentibacter sediminis]|uniref:NADP-dependent oxidoreductase n=1 Tax=Salegentibacter sediminis TaxID=1930251 RepID=UPI0009C09186|nr:NADP-dependent oxidoreductase [Salegentibacter sediminis]
MNRVILLNSRPKGTPSLENFQITEEQKPEPGPGELLLKSKYISVDPYLRGRMRDEESYIPPFEVGKPLESMIVAEVIKSNNANFQQGDFVSGMLQWKEFQNSPGKGLNKINKEKAPLSAYLGILGLTGLTAYIALDKIADLKAGETMVVSGAAGAVGSVVGQIGKIKGCKVVGIAGSDEKIRQITDKFGFDAGINYKTTSNMNEALAENCPEGIDVYYDNVGGEILDAVMQNINDFARIINCGAISLYNKEEMPTGPRVEGILIKKSALMQGFLVRNHVKDFGPAINQLATWLGEGKLKYEETVIKGFEKTPQAFLDLFEGKNKGKMVVEV